jgi:hypothetical protein
VAHGGRDGRVDLDPVAFLAQWAAWYPGSLPVGYLLGEAHRARWLRIHSLPGSRRYPESDEDWAELLHRHNRVATDLLGDGGHCVVVVPSYGPGFVAELRLRDRLGLRLLALVRDDFPESGEPEDQALDLYAAPAAWAPGAFDDVLRWRASDETGPIMFVARETGRAYAPYDGGADLFFPSSAERDEARRRYRAWLSRNPSGL